MLLLYFPAKMVYSFLLALVPTRCLAPTVILELSSPKLFEGYDYKTLCYVIFSNFLLLPLY
jgi:hypothetical protein